MNELVEFQRQRIIALQDKVNKLELNISELEQLLIEVCHKDCTKEFKQLVLTDILNK